MLSEPDAVTIPRTLSITPELIVKLEPEFMVRFPFTAKADEAALLPELFIARL